MKKRILRTLALPAIFMVGAALTFTACGGSGGGGGGVSVARLVAVSFVGFPSAPSPGGSGIPLPSVFRDEVIEFVFSAPIDDEIFGGFVKDGAGNPLIFRGLAPNAAGEVFYNAYVFQSAARNSLQIRANAIGGPFLPSYIVGRLIEDPSNPNWSKTLIVDPRVSAVNSFGLPANPGYAENTEYTYRIPQGNGILINGMTVEPVGVDPTTLPIATPVFSPRPDLSALFFSGVAFSPDPIPPEVLTILPLNTPPGQPIPADEGFEVRFSKLVDVATIDPLRNFRILNNDVLTGGATGDPSQVPGNYVFQEVNNQTVVQFIPTPGFGPGLGDPPTAGYTITVKVGSFGDPSIPPIKGQPQGSPPTPLPLANSLAMNFTTIPTPGAPGSATYVEDFSTQDQYDNSPEYNADPSVGPVFPNFHEAYWAVPPVSDPCSGTLPPGLGPLTQVYLHAVRICGNPLATTGNGGNPAFLGSRLQFDLLQTVSPSLFPPSTMGLTQPFDDAQFNLGATVNPDGGSHLMQLYEDTDVGNNFPSTSPVPLTDSLELIEWGPTSDTVQGPTCYPDYQLWLGMTTQCAPAQQPVGTCVGLSPNYMANYDVPTVQAVDPMGFGGVLCSPVGAYVITNPMLARYMAFPINQVTFDYNPNDGGVRHLVVEQNIEPASGNAPPPLSPPNPPNCSAVFNVNRFVAGLNFPRRRIFGAPISIQLQGSGSPQFVSTAFGGWDRYDWRFTWVQSRSQAQSRFFFNDGIPNPTYQSITIIPSPLNQPPGTSSRWEVQATEGITPMGDPFGVTTSWLTYWDGMAFDPNNPGQPTGQFFPDVLQQINGFKYVRFRVTMRANHLAPLPNGSFGTFQSYTGVIFNVAF